jgi:hypothetical protein
MRITRASRLFRRAPGLWPLVLLAAGCGRDEPSCPVDSAPGPFVLRDTSSVVLALAAGERWDDPVTGLRFVFPEGAAGKLTRGRIQDGPARPWADGAGVYVDYAGEGTVRIRIAHEAGGYECLLAYGTPRGSWTDGQRERWFAMPMTPAGRADSLDAWLATRPRVGSEACEASPYYWLLRFPAGSSRVDSLDASIAVAQGFLAAWLDSLHETQRAVCRQRMSGGLAPRFCPDGSYYSGFFRPCDGALEPRPRIGLRPGASAGDIAHQVGHYAAHLLVGDDAYALLERDAGFDPTLGTPRYERRGVIEDYARYHEYLFTGAVTGAGDPAEPATFFAPGGAPPAPEAVDVPSLQGYGVLLLHALGRRDPVMTCLTGETLTVPLAGLDYGTLAEHVLAHGPASTESLRGAAEAYLSSRGMAECLPALTAATGWCYFGEGHVVDRGGHLAEGVEVRNVIRAGDRDYRAPGEPARSDSTGQFTLHRVLSGPSTLRATVAGDSFDTRLTIAWTKRTTTRLQLGTLVAWSDLSSMERLRIRLDLGFATASGDTLPFEFNQVLADTEGVFARNRICLESPFAYACAPGADPATCWVLDSLEIRYDLGTGEVEDLRFRVRNLTDPPTALALRATEPLQASMPNSKRIYFVDRESVPAAVARRGIALELVTPAGERYTEVDLRGERLWLEVRAYCG